MTAKILMPALSPTMTEGIINKWLVKVGDTVKAGDIIAEIETDKATMEVEAVDEGKITHLLKVNDAKKIPVNSVIAIIDGDKDENIEDQSGKTEQIHNFDSGTLKKNSIKEKIIQNELNELASKKNDKRVMATPLVKNIAKNKNIDLNQYKGTGPNGRIIKKDIDDNNLNKISENLERNGKVIVPNTMRKVIAQRTLEAKQQIPHYYLTIESNVDKLISLRKKINSFSDIKISFNDLIVKAIAIAVEKNPETNASWNNEKIIKYETIDVSVAIALEDGLITPIVKKANSKDLKEISKEIKNLLELAKKNKLQKEQYDGGSITVSNLGMFGITEFSAIINSPQSSILAIGSIIEKPIVQEKNVIIGNTLKSTLSADHRVLDGAVAAKLLKDFNDIIENPFEIWLKSNDMEVI